MARRKMSHVGHSMSRFVVLDVVMVPEARPEVETVGGTTILPGA